MAFHVDLPIPLESGLVIGRHGVKRSCEALVEPEVVSCMHLMLIPEIRANEGRSTACVAIQGSLASA